MFQWLHWVHPTNWWCINKIINVGKEFSFQDLDWGNVNEFLKSHSGELNFELICRDCEELKEGTPITFFKMEITQKWCAMQKFVEI